MTTLNLDVSDDRLLQAEDRLGLSREFITNRLIANRRRTAVISDLLRSRGHDLVRMDVLEVGSHIGFGVLEMVSEQRRVGLEYYSENVNKAKSLADIFSDERAEFQVGDAASLPFESESFDFVHSHHVIEHMRPSKWGAYLSEMARVLRREGTAFVSFPHFFYPIEGHYNLPFLHWMPKRLRPRLARLSPRYKHVHEAELTYQQTARDAAEVTFTEFPRTKRVIQLARDSFGQIEDVTKEFTEHSEIAAWLGPLKTRLAITLADTFLCPERKLLMSKPYPAESVMDS